VSRRFGAPRTAVYNWRRDGIPAKYWIEFQAAAKADGKQIPLDAIRWRPPEPPHKRRAKTAEDFIAPSMPQQAGAD